MPGGEALLEIWVGTVRVTLPALAKVKVTCSDEAGNSVLVSRRTNTRSVPVTLSESA